MWQPPNEWRWIIDDKRSGAENMAVDELLTRNSIPTIRWYDWKKPTLSLGFHQPSNNIDWDKIDKYNIDVCRRPSGGRAVMHHNVATYSVVVPITQNNEPTLWNLYKWIGEWWYDALVNFKMKVEFVEEPATRPGANYQSCFASGNKYELLVNGLKIIGSAQRRYPNVVLQHGSLRIAKPVMPSQFFFTTINANEPNEDESSTSLEEVLNRNVENSTLLDWMVEIFQSKGYVKEVIPLSNLEMETVNQLKSNYEISREKCVI